MLLTCLLWCVAFQMLRSVAFLSQSEVKISHLLKDCFERNCIKKILPFYSMCFLQCFCKVEPESTAALPLAEQKKILIISHPLLLLRISTVFCPEE